MGQMQIPLDLAEQAAPSTVANRIRLYSKDISGVAEFYIRDSSGHEVRITRNGTAGGAKLTEANTWAQKQTMPILGLTPQTSEPPGGQLGDLYVRDPYGLVYFHNGASYNLVSPIEGWFDVSPYVEDARFFTAAIGGDGKTWLTAKVASVPLMLTTDRGATWNPITALGSAYWTSTAIGYDNLTMLAAHSGAAMQMSLDGGVTWNPVTPGGLTTVNWCGAAIGSDNQTMLACVCGGRIYKTTNRWSTWTEVQPLGAYDGTWYGVAIGQDNLTMLAVNYNNKVHRSLDGGTVWTDVTPPGCVYRTYGFWSQPGIGQDNLTYLVGEAGQAGGSLWKTEDALATPWKRTAYNGAFPTDVAVAVGGPTPTLLVSDYSRLWAYINFLE